MANHIIIQVRDAVIARLKAASTAAGTRVYAPYELNIENASATTPFILVRVGSAPRERMAIGSGADASAPQVLEDVSLSLNVHCVTKLDGDAETTAYNLAGEVDVSLLSTMAGKTLGGLVYDITPREVANDQNQLADQEAYQADAQYEVKIRHLEGSPTSFAY